MRLEKMIRAHEVDYLADNLRQTMTEMINTLQNVTTIKFLNKYKTPITLKKLKEKLSLVKDKREAQYKAECLDQMNFFLKTNLDSTAWDKLAKRI